VRATQGFFTIERSCPQCHGGGRVIENPCKTCDGAGRVHKEKTLEVHIPEGVENGSRIRLAGEGEAGLRGAPSGDLYIFVNVKPHPLFERQGADLHCRVPITMTQAALGDQIEVPVIDGSKTRLSVPSGTQSGQQFRLRGKGMSILRRHSRGDLYITAQVETPVNLTKRQKELLKEFDEVSAKGKKKHHPEGESFFTKVKDFLENLTD
jgi:molecular chaperone DnaJ